MRFWRFASHSLVRWTGSRNLQSITRSLLLFGHQLHSHSRRPLGFCRHICVLPRSLMPCHCAAATAANALACVAPEHAWLLDPAPPAPAAAGGPVFGVAAALPPHHPSAADWRGDEAMPDQEDRSQAAELAGLHNQQLAQQREPLAEPATVAAAWDVSSEPKRVLSLAELQAEAALAAVSCHTAVSDCCYDVCSQTSSERAKGKVMKEVK